MSSQNLLSNVFVPTYTYNSDTSSFELKVNMSNINEVSADHVSVYTASVSDYGSNVYVGSNAGNSSAFQKGCVYNTALGVSAGYNISNVSNSVYVGYSAGIGSAGSSNVIAIGTNSIGSGSNNIAIGSNTGVSGGSNNILIGQGISPGSTSNTLNIANYVKGDIANKYFGLGKSPAYQLDVSGRVFIDNGSLGINTSPLDHTLNLNGDFYADHGYGSMAFYHSGNDTTLTLTSSAAYPNNVANILTTGSVKAQGGFYTANGQTTLGANSSVLLCPIKRGMSSVLIINNADTTNKLVGIYYSVTTSVLEAINEIQTGLTMAISANGNDIEFFSLAGGTYTYSVTYLSTV
jgi:hypothetical protein